MIRCFVVALCVASTTGCFLTVPKGSLAHHVCESDDECLDGYACIDGECAVGDGHEGEGEGEGEGGEGEGEGEPACEPSCFDGAHGCNRGSCVPLAFSLDLALDESFDVSLDYTGEHTFDTTTGTLYAGEPGEAQVECHSGELANACVWRIESLRIGVGTTLHVIGDRALVIVAHHITIDGELDVGAQGAEPGPGGSRACTSATDCPRGDAVQDSNGGGGHGSFATPGSPGRGTFALVPLTSGGAGASTLAGGTGGGGGGALALLALETVRVTGEVRAVGGHGVGQSSGGGAGGGVLLEAPRVEIEDSGHIDVRGGAGDGAVDDGTVSTARGQNGDGAAGRVRLVGDVAINTNGPAVDPVFECRGITTQIGRLEEAPEWAPEPIEDEGDVITHDFPSGGETITGDIDFLAPFVLGVSASAGLVFNDIALPDSATLPDVAVTHAAMARTGDGTYSLVIAHAGDVVTCIGPDPFGFEGPPSCTSDTIVLANTTRVLADGDSLVIITETGAHAFHHDDGDTAYIEDTSFAGEVTGTPVALSGSRVLIAGGGGGFEVRSYDGEADWPVTSTLPGVGPAAIADAFVAVGQPDDALCGDAAGGVLVYDLRVSDNDPVAIVHAYEPGADVSFGQNLAIAVDPADAELLNLFIQGPGQNAIEMISLDPALGPQAHFIFNEGADFADTIVADGDRVLASDLLDGHALVIDPP